MKPLLPLGVNLTYPGRLFIDGEWVPPQSGRLIEVISPDTEEVSARIAEADAQDMDQAVAAARKAFDQGPWPRLSHAERGAYMKRISQILASRQAELVEAYRNEIGALKPFAEGMIAAASQMFAVYADLSEQFEWESRTASAQIPNHTSVILREPVGVVAAIAPWNAPYSIMTQKLAPALIAGCTVIMKPSPETPLEAYIIAEAAEKAGLPEGVVNLVPGHRAASDHLIHNPGLDKISFTGSTAAGRRIASVAGERMTRVTLELGGKSPAIITPDYPSEIAGPMLARTLTVMSGQVCAMLSRALVPQDRHDEFAEAIAAEMKAVKVGYSDDPASEMGPIAMKRQLEKIEELVKSGIEEGATLVTGGRRPPNLNKGFFFEPTLFSNVRNDMRIARKEIFGPVLCLIPYRDIDHAIEIANDTDYGLNASILTQDPEQAEILSRRIRSGGVAQNGMKADFSLPFGGYKQSGIGREGGVEGILPYTETKVILIENPST